MGEGGGEKGERRGKRGGGEKSEKFYFLLPISESSEDLLTVPQ